MASPRKASPPFAALGVLKGRWVWSSPSHSLLCGVVRILLTSTSHRNQPSLKCQSASFRRTARERVAAPLRRAVCAQPSFSTFAIRRSRWRNDRCSDVQHAHHGILRSRQVKRPNLRSSTLSTFWHLHGKAALHRELRQTHVLERAFRVAAACRLDRLRCILREAAWRGAWRYVGMSLDGSNKSVNRAEPATQHGIVKAGKCAPA
mmetsp:Transcript_12007/g.31782  ORF Transcript_12007/g.31782 Transcript_12007/m.31782 type:complete len:205 (-) Transcript_12007:707-1321(-)